MLQNNYIHYELINPSDPYTFLASSRETAALTIFLLSTGFAAKAEDGDEQKEIPLFLFGGSEEWYYKTFKRTVEEGLKALMSDVAEALDSFMLGDFEDRKRYELALSLITEEEKREIFKAEWQDARSSCNNIGNFAHETARKIRNQILSKNNSN